MSLLLLKYGQKNRPNGQWSADYYDVVDDGCTIGHIFYSKQDAPRGRPWFWGNLRFPNRAGVDHGHATTRAEALAAFKVAWEGRQLPETTASK